MPQPTAQAVHAVDVPLTYVSTAYIQDLRNFIATQAFPIVSVEHATDKFYTYTKADWFRDEAKERADGTESAGSGYGLTTDSYTCKVFSMHKDIGYQTRANVDPGIDLDRDATRFVSQRIMLKVEKEWTSAYFTTGKWANDVTPANLWSDYTNSDPVEDVETGKATILENTGFEANTLILGYHTYRRLRNHPDIIERVKYTMAGGATTRQITPDLLAAVFDIDRVLIAKGVENTAVEGETASYSFVQGKHALICHSAKMPGLLTPTCGYTFSWRGVSQGLGTDVAITRFYMNHIKSDRVEGEAAFAMKLVGSDLGYFLASVVS
jgi:hypothetical protein